MANNDTTNLILGYNTVHQEADSHKDPGKPWRLEDQKAKETQQSIWISPTPYVHQCAAQAGTEEWY